MESEKLSQAVDLNKDGVFSFDTTEEFICIKNETIRFESYGNRFIFNNSNFSGISINNVNNLQYFECSDAVFNGLLNGTFKMTDSNTIELKFSSDNLNPEKTIKYNLTDNKLITTSTEQRPISYSSQSQSWTFSQLQVRREYTHIVN